MIKQWSNLEQVYHIKVKGMLAIGDLERIGKAIDVKMQTLRQPDASRGHGENYWYEVSMRDSKKEELRNILFKEMHPLEKLKRVGLGPLTVEGIPRGRYRMLEKKEIDALKSGKFAERLKPLDVKRETPESILREQREKAIKKSLKPYTKPAHRDKYADERRASRTEEYADEPSVNRRRDGAFAPFGGPTKQKEAPRAPFAKKSKWKGGGRPARAGGAARPGGPGRNGKPGRSGGAARPGMPGRPGKPGRKFSGRPPKKFTPRG